MIRSLTLALFALLIISTAQAGDLYKVTVASETDAVRLTATGVEPVARLVDAYLVLADKPATDALAASGLAFTLLATNVTANQLALDNRHDRANVNRYPLLYEEGGFRIYRAALSELNPEETATDLRPIRNERLKIAYPKRDASTESMLQRIPEMQIGLDSLMSKISQDSLTSYLERLQAFYRRVATSDSNRVARDWIMSKLQGFGYDSIVVDSFTANIGGTYKICENVLAVKVGTRFPNHYVIVGAHRDAVSVSPGADDNGTGSVGVLEIARALADEPTDMTFIFALFDAEEYGLYGSYHYADEAATRGDSIVYMLNMDMIAQYTNTNGANLYYGSLLQFTNLWIHLADSLMGITGTLAGASSGSDHYPFTQHGYDATFVQEGIFSTVYHTSRDSTTYVSYPYMTRMVKASLATVYTVSQTAGPAPMVLFDFPSGKPNTLAPEVPDTILVNITGGWGGVPVQGSGRLHYSFDGGSWQETPLVDYGSNPYLAIIPAAFCNERCRYYISINEAGGSIFYSPNPANPTEAVVSTSFGLPFEDDFDTQKQWLVTGDAATGVWGRGIPNGGGDRGDPPTAFSGSYCYMTGAGDGDTDVDNGTTILTSPTFAINYPDALIHYARWYNNSAGSGPNEDVFRVYLSNNNGLNFTVVDSAGPFTDAAGGWVEHSFWVKQFMNPTSYMKIRFEASDLINGSLVEAAVDAVTVTTFQCVEPYICGDINGDHSGPDISDLSQFVDYLFLAGEPPFDMRAANLDGDPEGQVDIADLTCTVNRLFFGDLTCNCGR